MRTRSLPKSITYPSCTTSTAASWVFSLCSWCVRACTAAPSAGDSFARSRAVRPAQLGYCLWKSSANLRKLNAELSEVVGRREFMEKQEERLTGKKARGDGKGGKKSAKSLDGAEKGKEAAERGTMVTAGLGGLAALA